MDSLFPQPSALLAVDPSTLKKKRHQVKKPKPTALQASRRYAAKVPDFKPNPFRQPIGDPDELEFRHMNWEAMRAKVRRGLVGTGHSTTALDRFDNCGAECLVEWSEEAQRYRLKASYCHCRHCRPCQKSKAGLIARNLKEKLEAGPTRERDRFRFITLTLRHSKKPLKEQIKELYRHFRVLRRSELWKKTQVGGAVMLECSLNVKGEWHPHLHVISEGKYIRQDKLANEWMRLTDGSFKVDVRQISSGKDAAAYVSKYVTKGTVDEVWHNDDKAQEWILATKGLRSCGTFGSWRGFKLLKRDPASDVTDWQPVALLSKLCAGARAGVLADSLLLLKLADALQYDPAKATRPRPEPPS